MTEARGGTENRPERERLERFFREELAAAEAEAPDIEQIAAWLDGTLERGERDLFEQRLAEEPLLRREVEDLVELRLMLRERDPRARRWLLPAGLAAAAAVALAAVLWWRPAPDRQEVAAGTPPAAGVPATVATLRDAGREIIVRGDGGITGLSDLPGPTRSTVASALLSGRLALPDGLEALRGRSSILMGEPEDGPALDVLSPLATAVRDARPTFRWTAQPGALAHAVSIYTEDLAPVLASPQLYGSEWTPAEPLAQGRTYLWQVAASTAEGRVVAPRPPAPDARFRVLTEQESAALDEALASAGGSRLVAGVLLAEAGVLDEAEAALAALVTENPDSAEARRLLEAVRAARGRQHPNSAVAEPARRRPDIEN